MDPATLVEQLEWAERRILEGSKQIQEQRARIAVLVSNGVAVEVELRVLNILECAQVAHEAERDQILAVIAAGS